MPARVAWSPELPLKLPRKRPPPFSARRDDAEFRLQCAVVDMLRKLARPGWAYFHIPLGEYRTEATARRLKRAGVLPGLFDLMLIGPSGTHYWLELKTGRGVLSEGQLGFADLCRERGIPHAVAHGFNEAEAQLRNWHVLRPESTR
jgi:hypothetical protein